MEFGDLPAVIPSAGVLGLLVVFIVRVMVLASADRNDYRVRIVEQHQEHRAEIDALVKRHNAQIADLRQQLTELRGEVKQLRGEVEQERRARHQAEEDAARLRRQAGLSDDRP